MTILFTKWLAIAFCIFRKNAAAVEEHPSEQWFGRRLWRFMWLLLIEIKRFVVMQESANWKMA